MISTRGSGERLRLLVAAGYSVDVLALRPPQRQEELLARMESMFTPFRWVRNVGL